MAALRFPAVEVGIALQQHPEREEERGQLAADLQARQVWWWATVTATGLGIGLLFMMKSIAVKVLGIAVIALPHVIGAPHHAAAAGSVPATLANAFAASSIATAAVFCIVLGVMLGYLLSRNTTNDETTA